MSAEPKEAQNAAGRRTRARVFLVANAALLASIVLMLNYLAFRHYQRWDWTEQSIFTLSDRSERVLAELRRPIEIWLLLSESEPEHAELRNLLERYRAGSDRVELHYVDPHRDPGAYDGVVRRFRLGLAERATREGVVVTSDIAVVVAAGERHWEIDRDDLVSRRVVMDDGDEPRIELNVEAERAVTGAIVQVTQGRPTKVCFTTGRGEISLDRGLAELAAEMRRENLTHGTITTREPVPSDCDAVAIVGPQLAFDEAAAELLRDYVRGGGNLFLAVDPVLDPDQRRVLPTGLEGLLRDFGIRLDASIVVEPHPEYLPPGPGHPVVLYVADDFGEHAIAEPFRRSGFQLLISEARTVRPIGEEARVLLRASDRSYGETDLRAFVDGDVGRASADDIPGPAPLGVATRVEVLGEEPEESEDDHGHEERARRGGRVVVLGDATMLTSELLGHPAAGNRAFAGAALGWLTEREALVSIPPRTVSRPGLPSEDDVMNLFFRVVVLIPLAFVFLGIAVWWNRRL